ncbi:MAG: trehalose-phosphatase [Ponticaulis sp.]|nr:trehalose-phosphatase [Ponticaulis sp.]|tara:strand:- start:25625 stop:26341 length:717 start_codon:yes stop_codon:yes gene_type:complete
MQSESPPPLSPGLALFLDFDGTLAPLQDNPETVAISDPQKARLDALKELMSGAVAVISGRDVRDLSKRIPVTLWRAGNHGLYIFEPGELPPETLNPAPETLVEKIQQIIAEFQGTTLEIKGRVLAVHYRSAPHAEAALASELETILADYPDYKLQGGKFVLEAKPKGAHKGAAVEMLMKKPPFAGRTPVFVGDDRTDEDAIEVVVAMGGWAVKVGDGNTCAQYRLAAPDAVWSWLGEG